MKTMTIVGMPALKPNPVAKKKRAPVKRKVVAKKPAVKKITVGSYKIKRRAMARSKAAHKPAPVRRVVKSAVRAAPRPAYRYVLQCKKTDKGIWRTLFASNSKPEIMDLAKFYAKRYPRHYFQVK